MFQDEIIKEVRAIREAYAEQFGFDIQAIWQDAKKQEGKSGWLVIALEPKHIPVAIEWPEKKQPSLTCSDSPNNSIQPTRYARG